MHFFRFRLYTALAALVVCLQAVSLRSLDCFDLHYCTLAAHHKVNSAPRAYPCVPVAVVDSLRRTANLETKEESAVRLSRSSSSSSSFKAYGIPRWLETVEAIIHTDELFFMETFCRTTAQNVVALFACPSKPTAECSLDYRAVMQAANGLTAELFADVCTAKPSVQVYHIKMPGHSIALLKYSDSSGSWFKVYESWADNFSVLNWLSTKPLMQLGWLKKDEYYEAMTGIHAQYGQNRLITAKDLQNFMLFTFKDNYKEGKPTTCTIKQFIVDTEHIDKKLQEKLAEAKEARALWDEKSLPGLGRYFSHPKNRYFAGNPAWAEDAE